MSQSITLSSLMPVLSQELLACDFSVVTLELVVHDRRIVRWSLTRQVRSETPPVMSAPDARDNV